MLIIFKVGSIPSKGMISEKKITIKEVGYSEESVMPRSDLRCFSLVLRRGHGPMNTGRVR